MGAGPMPARALPSLCLGVALLAGCATGRRAGEELHAPVLAASVREPVAEIPLSDPLRQEGGGDLGGPGAAADAEEGRPPPQGFLSSFNLHRLGDIDLSLLIIPRVLIEAEHDKTHRKTGIELETDLKPGFGWGLRLGQGGETGGFGLLYVTAGHRERDTDSRVRTHSLYAEALLTRPLFVRGPVRVIPGVATGIGGAFFDFPRFFDDTGGVAWEIRGTLALELFERSYLSLGGAYFLWGYPSRTLGSGMFALIEVGVRF
ncbi:MAG: hypothetical protein ACE5GW_02255 [Planctomycetota bacterium]